MQEEMKNLRESLQIVKKQNDMGNLKPVNDLFSKDIKNAPFYIDKELIMMIEKAENSGHSFENIDHAYKLQYLTNKKIKFISEWGFFED